MGFKLLAVRPLTQCGNKFLKNLEPNRIYKLYDNYEFYSGEQRVDIALNVEKYSSIDKIEYNSIIPDSFFSKKISLSAIVGKNGSGKSSLIDLFVAAINQVSLKLFQDQKLYTTADLISTGNEKEQEIHCELYYEIDKIFYQMSVSHNNFSLTDFNSDIVFDFEKFFYSEIVSYSIYAFNSWQIGDWVDNLFHKNDSYQIPVVINPKRESKRDGLAGIIDINNEEYLLQQRLLAIIMSNPEFVITDNLSTQYISLKYKSSKPFFILDDEQRGKKYNEEEDIQKNFYNILNSRSAIKFTKYNDRNPSAFYLQLKDVLREFKMRYGIADVEIPNYQYKIDIYILYKITSICEKYVSYNQFIKLYKYNPKHGFSTIDIKGFLDKIESSQSHIVLKLKQSINFIKNYEKIWAKFSKKEFIPIKQLSGELKKINREETHLINILPPAFFETRLFSNNFIDLLDRISSGERQLIHTLSTVVYHLSNLNSVESDKSLVKYNYINIILDEIELYFHPEYQKQFINRLIIEIDRLDLSKIHGINILIISHSPFILSDIPKQNVLFLEKGKPVSLEKFKNTNTFAANFSDLLSDSFFIQEGLLGDFAKGKINEVIEWLNIQIDRKRGGQIINCSNEEITKYKQLIKIIDEPIIKMKLLEMYSEVFSNEDRIEYLEIEKQKIEMELEKLKAN